jgi:hypothetical protein
MDALRQMIYQVNAMELTLSLFKSLSLPALSLSLSL